MKFRKREPTEKKQFLLPGQGEEEVYSHTNPPKVFIGGLADVGVDDKNAVIDGCHTEGYKWMGRMDGMEICGLSTNYCIKVEY